MRRAVIGGLVLLLALVGCSTGTPAGPAPSVDPELEALRLEHGLPDCPATDPAAEAVDGGLPATALPCLGSDVVVNLAGLERKPMVVNFWAQWCEPCRQEAPFLADAAARHTDVAFIGINFDDDRPDWALEFAGLAGWTYPHVRDANSTLKRIGVPGLPATFFVDADGRIAGRHPGVITSAEQLAELMQTYLGVS